MDHAGVWSLLPALVTLGLALVSRKTFEALLGGCAVGFVLLEIRRSATAETSLLDVPKGAFNAFIAALTKVMADPVIGWIILVVGLFGSLIALLVKAGGALAFGQLLARHVRSRRGAMLSAYVLGLFIFIDDYLNALTVGTSMRRLFDRFRISRQMLAYVVDSTSAPVCVLVPFSTWAVYTAGLLEQGGMATEGQGLQAYLQVIPYLFYPIAALIVLLLVILGLIPIFGPLMKAEDNPSIPTAGPAGIRTLDEEQDSAVPIERARALNFILPILVLVFYTWYSGTDIPNGKWFGSVDALQGVMAAILVTSILYLWQRITTVEEFSATFFAGFATMLVPLAIVISSFVLVEVNSALGLTQFVIEAAGDIMRPALLPFIAFVSMGFVAFATGSFWGMYAVALPIIIPLANQLGVPAPLAVGAVISAGAMGSHICPFGDSTVLSSTGAGCDNMSHVYTQMPYGLLSAGLAAIGYALAGWLMI
jgi:Na+/H+ antiporter NhaC